MEKEYLIEIFKTTGFQFISITETEEYSVKNAEFLYSMDKKKKGSVSRW